MISAQNNPLPKGEGGRRRRPGEGYPARSFLHVLTTESVTPHPARLRRSTLSLWERVRALIILFVFIPLTAHAVTPGELLPDPAQEARARAITGELRCLVCQNQSIDDSDAALAKDLRVLVREKIKDGMSDAEVKDYVHSRYGDFVLLRPPLRLGTLLLWLAPLLVMLAGATFVVISARRRAALAVAPAALTEEERARLKKLGVEKS